MLDIISGIERIFPTDQMFATAWTNSPGSTFCFGLFLPEQTQFLFFGVDSVGTK